jgi:hypothetical protein
LNRLRRSRGPALRDQCATVIMHMCTLQLERGETRELAAVKGSTGPMLVSGGAITAITYRVFDKNADRLDKSIKEEPWRAFSEVTMRITVERDPEFEVKIDGKDVEAKPIHKAPGLTLVAHLCQYFPLIAKPHQGPAIIPWVRA